MASLNADLVPNELHYSGPEHLDPVYVAGYDAKSGIDPLEDVAALRELGLGTESLTYEHSGKPADVLYTRHALHHLPDFWKAVALQRMAAMLRPGGILRLRDLIYAFEPAESPEYIGVWLRDAAASPDVGWTAEELAMHVARSTARSRGCSSR